MIFSIKCESAQGVKINSLGVSLQQGQTMDCPKERYESNREIQALVSTGLLSVSVKQATSGKLNVPNPKVKPRLAQTQVIERVIERVVEPAPLPDMEALTQNLISQLGAMLSPELLAQAIAKQLPTQAIQSAPNQTSTQQGIMETAGEELTFIPSKIITETSAPSKSMVNETKSEGSTELSDALSALKALRKANKS
jgi:hypothetical protein